MPDIKQRAHKMLKEILSDINLNGVGFGNKDMAKYYRGGYMSAKNKIRRKLPAFIDEIIDMRDKEIVEIVYKRIFELNEDIQPLQKEYDTAYKYWNHGIHSEQIKKICEEYESGSKGNKLFALSEKMEEAENIINLISKPKLSAEALNIK